MCYHVILRRCLQLVGECNLALNPIWIRNISGSNWCLFVDPEVLLLIYPNIMCLMKVLCSICGLHQLGLLLLKDGSMICQVILGVLNGRTGNLWATNYIANVDHMSLGLVWLGLVETARGGALLHYWLLLGDCGDWASSKLILRELFEHLPLFLDILLVFVQGCSIDC